MSVINLDVTLRDGGYRNNFDFSRDFVVDHARRSVEAGFDWVEIAYRKGSFKPMPGIGLTGVGEDALIRDVADVVGPEHVGLILHPKNIDDDDLPAMYAAGARLVRICMPAGSPEPALHRIAQAKELGFTVSGNLTRVSHLALTELADVVGAIDEAGADVVYLADSNGSLSPQQVSTLVSLSGSVAGSPVGLHAHNNLGLALANSLAAVDAGGSWIDSSALGMGKGAGNLIAEQWIAQMDASSSGPAVDLGAALELAAELLREVPEGAPSLSLSDLVLARYDLTVEHAAGLPESHREGIAHARDLAETLPRRIRPAAGPGRPVWTAPEAIAS